MGRGDEFKLDRRTTYLLRQGLVFLVVLLLIIFFFFLAGFFIQKNASITSDGQVNVFEVSGSMGDTINGILASIIGAAAVLTTFLAFIVQYQANQNQLKAFKEQADANKQAEEAYESQRKGLKLERFENRFYQMLRIHKENVSEMEIDGRYRGRRVFIKMYQELRFIYQLLLKVLKSSRLKKDKEWMIKVSYHHFFFGVFSNSKAISKGATRKRYENELLSKLNRIKDDFKTWRDKRLFAPEEVWNTSLKSSEGVKNELEMDFIPFGGHISRLGHYYRHLYQTVKTVATDPILSRQDDPERELKTRYEYVKLIRVQLSNHEQTMIYYNSFFIAGEVWWADETIDQKNMEGLPLSYIIDYKLIKNLPFNLTQEIGPDALEYFKDKMTSRLKGANRAISEEAIDRKARLSYEWKERELLERENSTKQPRD